MREAEAEYILKTAAEHHQAHVEAAIEATSWSARLIWGIADDPAPATENILIDLVTEPPGPGDVTVPDVDPADPLFAGMFAAGAADVAADGNEYDRALKTLGRCWRVRHCGYQCRNQSSSKCITGLCRKHCLKQDIKCPHCRRDGGQHDRGPRGDRTRRPGPSHHHYRRRHQWR